MFVVFRKNFSSTSSLCVKISAGEFQTRRANLLDTIKKSGFKSPIVFVHSKRKTFSSPNVPHVFRQCSNFRYLTGFDYTDNSQLLIKKNESVFFINPRTEHDILWNGKTLNEDEIISLSGVDYVLPHSEFENYLASIVRSDSVLAADLETLKFDANFDNLAKKSYLLLHAIPNKILVQNFLDLLRWRKSHAEIEIMSQTCAIGSAAMNATISQAKKFTNEAHLVGVLELEARRRGAQFLAYPPVVASGENANIIHYISSKKEMNNHECVLIDAGCDVDGYISDITRCFPLKGEFSDAQLTVYETLNKIQNELLDYVKNVRPLKLNEIYIQMIKSMAYNLDKICFFTNSLSWDELVEECDKLCPHHVGHYLGLDIHDSPTVEKNINILPGVVLTIEPGIYIQHNNLNILSEYRGMGFRIEDDIVITETGYENLTKTCIRNPNDIKSLMARDF